ncbi:MAG: thioredoxin [Planctomycetes bacterium DG_23]|nr:MAG: thioredoxin [Planctomycetes bacterium DG_23]
MAPEVVEVTDDSFEEEVLKADLPVLVDFWAVWCAPCHMMTPVFEEVAAEYAGKAKISKLNVDENPKTPPNYRITAIPTTILFKDGEIVEAFVGVTPKEKLTAALDAVL